MNVHIGKEENRNVFVGAVSSIAKLDMCVVTETWFREGEGEKIMERTLAESEYGWFGRDRKSQKRWYGDGGVGVLVKKGIGECKVAKVSKEHDMLWLEIKRGAFRVFVGAVYMCPEGSSRNSDVKGQLLELETDISEFRKKGQVICMGDFNSRIGCLESSIVKGDRRIAFPRQSEDSKVGGVAMERGRQFVETMNGCNMVILNGIDTIAKHTFQGANKGLSVVDMIILDDRFFPIEVVDEVQEDVDGEEEIKSVRYKEKSLRVWDEGVVRVGDHKLVTCEVYGNEVEEEKIPVESKERQSDVSGEVLGWRRRDGGDRKFWDPLVEASRESMGIWLEKVQQGEFELKHGDHLLTSYKQYLDEALQVGVGQQTKKGKKNPKMLVWSEEVFQKKCVEAKAYKAWKEQDTPERVQEFRKAKCARKKAVRKHKRHIEQKVVSDIEKLRTQNPKDYWKQLKALEGVSSGSKQLPNQMMGEDGVVVTDRKGIEEVWAQAFEKLGREEKVGVGVFDEEFAAHVKESVLKKTQVNEQDLVVALDQPIQRIEVDRAIKRLRRGKAVGIDKYMNEIFMYGGDKISEATWTLCSRVFQCETYPLDWARGLIFPIFKGGPGEWKRNPLKYRGITLLSVLGKVYVSVLNERVTRWAENSGVLAEEQAGFRKGRSTTDQLLILTEIIKNRRPAETYCCFLDVQKAYDRVWRDGLWEKLHGYGIKGKMWRVLRSVYEAVESSVIVNDQRTRFFKVDVGLRQGCLMSPILFALYVNGLAEEIKNANVGARIIVSKSDRCGILMFADDIVLIAEDREALKMLMEISFQYSRKWRFSFNYDKCSVVIYNNERKLAPTYGSCVDKCTCGYHWLLGNKLIKQEYVYKYLGMELDTQLTQGEFRKRIHDKARVNVKRVWAMGMRHGSLSVLAGINLYKALVRSILEYGAEVWKDIKWEEGERIQREMGRRILRCHGKTTNEAVLGELGWWKLRARRDFLKLKYWIKICLMEDTRLVRKVYLLSRERYLKRRTKNWCSDVHKLVLRYGLQPIWQDEALIKNPVGLNPNHSVLKYWEGVLLAKVHQKEEEDWKKGCSRKEKLRTYRTFKTKLVLENYLLSEKEKQGRYLLTKLRVGTNKLRIETGRWKRPVEKLHERICTQCQNGEVEDEKHFLLRCNRYQQLREELFTSIQTVTNFVLADKAEEDQWKTLMITEKKPGLISDFIKKFVRKAMRIREEE